MLPIYFNGKFYAAGLNGVHRVADRLIREYDAILAASSRPSRERPRLFVPRRRQWEPSLQAIEIVEQDGADSQKWEQFRLPRLAADGVLVNLCNLAPIRHSRKLTLIHDAQFLLPDSGYPARQRIGYRLLVPRMARTSAQVLTVSDYSRQMLDLMDVVPRDRTAVLYNGADHILDITPDFGALERLGLEAGRYVLMFGSPKGYKNAGVVLSAFADPPRGLRLVVVGAAEADLRDAGLPVPPGVVFAGKIDDAVLRALYIGAHALAFPSRTEGFGLPPVEAMLCHCPVVAAPAGAIPEVCRDAILYADVDDPSAWREAFVRLADQDLRTTKVTCGVARASGFTWKAAGQRLAQHIDRIADQG